MILFSIAFSNNHVISVRLDFHYSHTDWLSIQQGFKNITADHVKNNTWEKKKDYIAL